MHYIKITQFDTANGIAVGTVLWVAGCEHNCYQCHNPSTHNPQSGNLFTPATMKLLLHTMEPTYVKRLTLSGGDPLYPANRSVVTRIVESVKSHYPEKQIWVYTGYLWEQVKELDCMQYIDVLVDGPFILAQKNLNLLFRGSENQRLIDVQSSLTSTLTLWNS